MFREQEAQIESGRRICSALLINPPRIARGHGTVGMRLAGVVPGTAISPEVVPDVGTQRHQLEAGR